MKQVSKLFINEAKKEVGAQPVFRTSLYAKYAGPITSIAGISLTAAGTTVSQCYVYGNAARFFQMGDKVIVKSMPLSQLSEICSAPSFNGTYTYLELNGLELTDDNIGGYILRDIDYQFTVGLT